jgi:hypothetical protein
MKVSISSLMAVTLRRGRAASASLQEIQPQPRHCEERSDEAIQNRARGMDCFAEPVIGRRFAPTRWLAMTAMVR